MRPADLVALALVLPWAPGTVGGLLARNCAANATGMSTVDVDVAIVGGGAARPLARAGGATAQLDADCALVQGSPGSWSPRGSRGAGPAARSRMRAPGRCSRLMHRGSAAASATPRSPAAPAGGGACACAGGCAVGPRVRAGLRARRFPSADRPVRRRGRLTSGPRGFGQRTSRRCAPWVRGQHTHLPSRRPRPTARISLPCCLRPAPVAVPARVCLHAGLHQPPLVCF
jgi:hypothetical protein